MFIRVLLEGHRAWLFDLRNGFDRVDALAITGTGKNAQKQTETKLFLLVT